MAEEKKKRDGFGSKIGIIAAAAGSAIGLGIPSSVYYTTLAFGFCVFRDKKCIGYLFGNSDVRSAIGRPVRGSDML